MEKSYWSTGTSSFCFPVGTKSMENWRVWNGLFGLVCWVFVCFFFKWWTDNILQRSRNSGLAARNPTGASKAWAMFYYVTFYLSLWPWNKDFKKKKVKKLLFFLIYPGNKCLYKTYRHHLYTDISIQTWNIQDQLAVCFPDQAPGSQGISNRARYWCNLPLQKKTNPILHGTETCIGTILCVSRWILIECLMSINLRMWRDKRNNFGSTFSW